MVVSLSKTKVIERDFQVNCHVISTEKYFFLSLIVVTGLSFLHVTFACLL